MNWIIASLIMFFSSVALYLFVRKSNQLKTPQQLNNLAIVLIVGFSALIMVDRNKEKSNSNKLWLPYTIGAFFCWGLLALSSKYLLNLGVPILTRLIYSMIIVTVLIFSEMRAKKVKINVSKNQLITLLMIGVFASSFNYFMQVGFNLAPNVGYVNAANASSISLLTLLSAYFFKDDLNKRKLIGI